MDSGGGAIGMVAGAGKGRAEEVFDVLFEADDDDDDDAACN